MAHTPDFQDKLTNVHEALTEASLETRSRDDRMKNFTVRLKDETKLPAMKICEAAGTDLGTYLRKCAEALVRDYHAQPEDRPAE